MARGSRAKIASWSIPARWAGSAMQAARHCYWCYWLARLRPGRLDSRDRGLRPRGRSCDLQPVAGYRRGSLLPEKPLKNGAIRAVAGPGSRRERIDLVVVIFSGPWIVSDIRRARPCRQTGQQRPRQACRGKAAEGSGDTPVRRRPRPRLICDHLKSKRGLLQGPSA